MKIDNQRLRNLTTGKLHTNIRCIYEDLELITGEKGIMTHMIPRVMKAVEPWLKEKVIEDVFWNGEYDPNHVGEYTLPEPTAQEKTDMLDRYKKMPNPLAGKNVAIVDL